MCTSLRVQLYSIPLLPYFVLQTEEGIGTRAVEIRQTCNQPEILDENTVTATPQQLSTFVKVFKDHLDAPLAAARALARGELRRLVSARTLDHTADNCKSSDNTQTALVIPYPDLYGSIKMMGAA